MLRNSLDPDSRFSGSGSGLRFLAGSGFNWLRIRNTDNFRMDRVVKSELPFCRQILQRTKNLWCQFRIRLKLEQFRTRNWNVWLSVAMSVAEPKLFNVGSGSLFFSCNFGSGFGYFNIFLKKFKQITSRLKCLFLSEILPDVPLKLYKNI